MHRDESQKLPIQLDGLFDGAAPRRHVVQWLEARRVLDPDYDTAATSFLHLTIRKHQLKNNGTDPRWYTFTEQWIFWKIGKKLGTTRVSLLTFIRIYIYMYSLLMQIYIYICTCIIVMCGLSFIYDEVAFSIRWHVGSTFFWHCIWQTKIKWLGRRTHLIQCLRTEKSGRRRKQD